MDSHFRDKINLPNSHSSVLGHCYLFLVKNRVFGLLDRIASKLPQKIKKNSRTTTPLEGTSYGTPPLKIQNFIFRLIFHFFSFFIFLEKSEKIYISFIWFFEFFGGIFIFLWFYLTGFWHFFYLVFLLFLKSKTQNCWKVRVWWLIIHKNCPDYKIRNSEHESSF